MDERDKIIKIISEWYVCENYRCYIYDEHIRRNIKSIADALIAANIGDVTEWKERAEKHRVQVLPDGTIKQLYGDEEVEDIARQRDEYKHRAEKAEKERDELKVLFNSAKSDAENHQKLAISLLMKEARSQGISTYDGCFFYATRMLKMLIQQAEREIEEEKND